jgi:hypothetical protein
MGPRTKEDRRRHYKIVSAAAKDFEDL